MSLKLINESFDKMYQEAISPEAKADSDVLKNIIYNHSDDSWNRRVGRNVEPLSKEEQDVLDKHDLKWVEDRVDIYPNEYEPDNEDTYSRDTYGVSRYTNRWSRERNDKVDLTQVGRKRFQRDKAGSAYQHHGWYRTSDERERLKAAVDDAQRDLDSAIRNNWKDDKKRAERSLKIRQGKLDKENQRLKDLRRTNTYLSNERDKLSKDMGKNIADFRNSKYHLVWADETDRDIMSRRADVMNDFKQSMQDLDQRVSDNEAKRQFHKDRINTLLRRNTK